MPSGWPRSRIVQGLRTMLEARYIEATRIDSRPVTDQLIRHHLKLMLKEKP